MQDTRRKNLRTLAEQHGGINAFAAELGYTNGSFLVQMTGPHPIREVSERTARRIEEKAGLPKGWLDIDQSTPLPDSTVVSLIRHITKHLDEANVTIDRNKFADLVVLVYERYVTTGTIDDAYLKTIIGLLK